MRESYAHQADVVLGAGGDPEALGGAVTIALCGSWEHEPPCPLAPHHSEAVRVDDHKVGLRVVFATEPEQVDAVRDLIDEALRTGRLVGPDDRTTTWRLSASGPAALEPDETELARRLAAD